MEGQHLLDWLGWKGNTKNEEVEVEGALDEIWEENEPEHSTEGCLSADTQSKSILENVFPSPSHKQPRHQMGINVLIFIAFFLQKLCCYFIYFISPNSHAEEWLRL